MIVVDASVVVKWFKQDEDFIREASMLKEMIIRYEIDVCAPELLSLEVIRGIKKVQNRLKLTDDEVREIFQSIEDMFDSFAIRPVHVSQLKHLSAKVMIDTGLYMADSIYVACGILNAPCTLVTDDRRHMLRAGVKTYAQKFDVKIIGLSELEEELNSSHAAIIRDWDEG